MSDPEVSKPLITRSYLVGGNLISSNKLFFFFACLVLAIPEWLKIPLDTLVQAVPVDLLGRILELVLVYLLARRVINFHTSDATKIKLVPLLLVGIIVWLILDASLPFWMKAPDEMYSLALIGVSLSLGLTFLYWFHFIPAMFGITDPRKIVKTARSYHLVDRWLPFRACLGPAGLLLIGSGIVLSPWPDGRSTLPLYILPVIIGIYKTLTIYLSLSFGLVFLSSASKESSLDDTFLRDLDLRLKSIEADAPKKLSGWLTAKNGFAAVFIGVLIWFGNAIKLETSPPAATITTEKLIAGENKLTLVLHLHDDAHLMRGVIPELFEIAGEKRTPISGGVISVKDFEGKDVSGELPETKDITISIEYMSDRKTEEAKKLTDAFIWYRHAKITEKPVKLE